MSKNASEFVNVVESMLFLGLNETHPAFSHQAYPVIGIMLTTPVNCAPLVPSQLNVHHPAFADQKFPVNVSVFPLIDTSLGPGSHTS